MSTLRTGTCWLCAHRVESVACAKCGCLAHYPPWPPPQRVPCHVSGCVDHVEGNHVDALGDAIVHYCGDCTGDHYAPALATPTQGATDA